MAILANGIETLEFSILNWAAILNTNFGLLQLATAADTLLSGKALATHAHDGEYSLTAVTITQALLEPYLTDVQVDMQFTVGTVGVTVIDTGNAANTRLYVDNGVLVTEVVV